MYTVSDEFREQLRAAQCDDVVIKRAREELSTTGVVTAGRLKRVRKQLRVVGDILTKSEAGRSQ